MQNSKIKIAIILGVFLILSFIFGTHVLAVNDNLQIVKESDSKYLIYVKDNLDKTFEFAFADTTTEPASSEYKDAGTDAASGGNYIAYLDEHSTANKYLWVKNSEGYVLEGVEVNLDEAIRKADLEDIATVTKRIDVDTTKTNVEDKEIDGNTVTVTTGKVVINDEGEFKYQIFKVSDSEDYADLMDLAERISKFNDDTDMYTQVEVYREFFDLFNGLARDLVAEDWKDIEKNEILQPSDAKNGDKYVVWILQDGDILDAQFMTSKYEEAKVKEKITTKLPVTYDDNRLLIVLVVLAIATVAVSIRINNLKKDEK